MRAVQMIVALKKCLQDKLKVELWTFIISVFFGVCCSSAAYGIDVDAISLSSVVAVVTDSNRAVSNLSESESESESGTGTGTGTGTDIEAGTDNEVSVKNLAVNNALKKSIKTSFENKPGVSGEDVGRMLLGLIVVLLAIGGCSWLLKRVTANRLGVVSSLSVSGVLPLGAKEKVVVVEVEGVRLVLGVTATNITKLHVLDTGGAKPTRSDSVSVTTPIRSEFSEKINAIMKEGLKSD